MRKIIVLTLGILLLAASCNRTDNNEQVGGNTTPPPVTIPTPNPEPTPPPATSTDVTVNITSSGFSPSSVTVKKGTKVTFVNDDSRLRWPASGPHPSHTDYPQFDPKQGIAPTDSWEFTFDRTGEWRFHDHLMPTQFGSVTVTE